METVNTKNWNSANVTLSFTSQHGTDNHLDHKHSLCHISFQNDLTSKTFFYNNCYRQVNIMPKYPYHKKLQHFVLWWFYVRLGLVDNILKVGHNWSMGRCPISKMIFVDFSRHF